MIVNETIDQMMWMLAVIGRPTPTNPILYSKQKRAIT